MHHQIDPYPIPENPIYINEPWLCDDSIDPVKDYDAEKEYSSLPSDNIRVYVPLDLSGEAIVRRIQRVIRRFGAASEKNEFEYSLAVDRVIEHLYIYDQIWLSREGGMAPHSEKAVKWAEEIVKELESIPDECAETFPFVLIDELKYEFGV